MRLIPAGRSAGASVEEPTRRPGVLYKAQKRRRSTILIGSEGGSNSMTRFAAFNRSMSFARIFTGV